MKRENFWESEKFFSNFKYRGRVIPLLGKFSSIDRLLAEKNCPLNSIGSIFI